MPASESSIGAMVRGSFDVPGASWSTPAVYSRFPIDVNQYGLQNADAAKQRAHRSYGKPQLNKKPKWLRFDLQ
jgi:hypothetical protein